MGPFAIVGLVITGLVVASFIAIGSIIAQRLGDLTKNWRHVNFVSTNSLPAGSKHAAMDIKDPNNEANVLVPGGSGITSFTPTPGTAVKETSIYSVSNPRFQISPSIMASSAVPVVLSFKGGVGITDPLGASLSTTSTSDVVPSLNGVAVHFFPVWDPAVLATGPNPDWTDAEKTKIAAAIAAVQQSLLGVGTAPGAGFAFSTEGGEAKKTMAALKGVEAAKDDGHSTFDTGKWKGGYSLGKRPTEQTAKAAATGGTGITEEIPNGSVVIHHVLHWGRLLFAKTKWAENGIKVEYNIDLRMTVDGTLIAGRLRLDSTVHGLVDNHGAQKSDTGSVDSAEPVLQLFRDRGHLKVPHLATDQLADSLKVLAEDS